MQLCKNIEAHPELYDDEALSTSQITETCADFLYNNRVACRRGRRFT